MHHGLCHTLSFADDPSSETDVIPERSFASSLILTSIADTMETDSKKSPPSLGGGGCLIPESEVLDFHVFCLDLNLGALGLLAAAGALISQLETVLIANLVDECMVASSQHIDKLYIRVEDTSSKVLVTGDLNAGKSTFVNALLQCAVMPVDQQPCAAGFCEVHDFAENSNVEEVHVMKDAAVKALAGLICLMGPKSRSRGTWD